MYDYYGRPLPIPPQNQQYIQQIQGLENKLKDMENKLYGNYNQSSPTIGNSNINQPNNQKATQIMSLIPVNSIDEAWNYIADFTGAKQYFINDIQKEIYIKQFDANVPITHKEIYKLVNDTEFDDIIYDNHDPIMDKLNEIKELIIDGSNYNASDLEMDNTEISGKPTSTSKSNASGSKSTVSRSSNGKFRSNSKK